MKPNKRAVSVLHECFSEIVVVLRPGRIVIAGKMDQMKQRVVGVGEHGAVSLKERVTAAAAVAVVVYYHDCWRDARFLT